MKEQNIKGKHAIMPNKQAAYKPERKIYLYSWIEAPADRDNEVSKKCRVKNALQGSDSQSSYYSKYWQ